MTKREWKRRYADGRRLRKNLKWLRHESERNLTVYLRECRELEQAEFDIAADYFTKPPVVTDRCSITYQGKPLADGVPITINFERLSRFRDRKFVDTVSTAAYKWCQRNGRSCSDGKQDFYG